MLRPLALALALAVTAHPSATAQRVERLDLFLLAGQSNMAGRGTVEDADRVAHPRVFMLDQALAWQPAVDPMHFDKPKVVGVGPGRAFAIALADHYPEVSIGLVPTAVGGTSVRAWLPGAADSATSTHPYDESIVRARAAQKSGRLKAILWLQGESDSNERLASGYETLLTTVIANFRRDLAEPDLPFIIGQMGQFSERPWTKYRMSVDSAHRHLAATLANVAFVTSAGLTHRGDTVHYNASGARELGLRYEAAYRELLARSGRGQ